MMRFRATWLILGLVGGMILVSWRTPSRTPAIAHRGESRAPRPAPEEARGPAFQERAPAGPASASIPIEPAAPIALTPVPEAPKPPEENRRVESWLLELPDEQFAPIIGTRELDEQVARVEASIFSTAPDGSQRLEYAAFLDRLNKKILRIRAQ